MNPKPMNLLEIEHALWLLCLRLAEGQDFTPLFATFLENPKVTAALNSPPATPFFLLQGPDEIDSDNEPEPTAEINTPAHSDVDELDQTTGNSTPAQPKGKKRRRESDTTPTRAPSTRKNKGVKKNPDAAPPTKRSTHSKSKVTTTSSKVQKTAPTASSKAEQLMEFALLSHMQFVSVSIKFK